MTKAKDLAGLLDPTGKITSPDLGPGLALSGGLSVNGTITANSFSGNGAGLTSVGGGGNTYNNISVFTSNGTFNVPPSTTRMRVILVAGSPGNPGASGYNGTATGPAVLISNGGSGGVGGTGGTTSFGSIVTVTPTSSSNTDPLPLSVTSDFPTISTRIPTFTTSNSTGVFLLNNVSSSYATSTPPSFVFGNPSGVVKYFYGPFAASYPVVVGAGGAGGGGGGGGAAAASNPTGGLPPGLGVASNGTAASGTTAGAGGAGAPTNGFVYASGGGGGGGGGAGGNIPTPGGAGAPGGSTPVGAPLTGSPGLAGTTGTPLVPLTNSRAPGGQGGAGRNGNSCCPCYGGYSFTSGTGGTGGTGGYSGIVIVEYN